MDVNTNYAMIINHNNVAFMEMGDFWPVPATFQFSISLFMGIIGFLLPFGVLFIYLLYTQKTCMSSLTCSHSFYLGLGSF